ncbi:hypothetical protein K9O30_17790 [Clostridium bowmanii]|uniref:hypothetical protein n=1 Tax=Clostridium bowmanii TaxID=132925 RepID=UPI001C0B15B3|nr:hypothetical protein [Clostridium bowmanii]MBU3191145.1 hypothetical protein [Clostridium bowmanii]MCA1075536.1 hypothetical protein [Clostridium bowmanii]
MKKLITVNKVKQSFDEGCKVIVVDSDTLVTMAAKDKAMELKIEFKNAKQVELCNTLNPPLEKEKSGIITEKDLKDQVQCEELNYTEDLIQQIIQEVSKKLSANEKT